MSIEISATDGSEIDKRTKARIHVSARVIGARKVVFSPPKGVYYFHLKDGSKIAWKEIPEVIFPSIETRVLSVASEVYPGDRVRLCVEYPGSDQNDPVAKFIGDEVVHAATGSNNFDIALCKAAKAMRRAEEEIRKVANNLEDKAKEECSR